ncbi:hypothetical protein Q765_18600 [Flavobacterium rivuli WB 3.3-2 = DSM 21788]|uniref:DUF4252 domain-containing protein n=1 Tax=Flavobacterium rivuli WB 3.3-2 = DSM 21788 TaxID=1121895 RepID=A0A0A2M0M6_9FLAO|nr:DUF4252 domain-containing protein [Flavobacterium rivuli]KGO85023.1 hypothetical protein Q765_18600 [Flavobacterium rivuli WB 3.3-2 = DSM 21788]
MKKIIIVLLLAVLPTVAFAQKAFRKLRHTDGIAAINVSNGGYNALNDKDKVALGSVARDYLSSASHLDNLNVFISSEKKHARTIKRAMLDYLGEKQMEELINFEQDGSGISIYMKKDTSGSDITEMLLFVENRQKNESVLISFTGTLGLNKK